MTKKSRRGAFTLAELLISITVLALLVVLIAQLMRSATDTIMNSRRHMDADNEARLVFDRFAVDFSRMIQRPDVDYHMRKIDGTASDEIAFYAHAAGYYSAAPASTPTRNQRNPNSVIGYRVRSFTYANKAQCLLERVSKGLGWEPSGTNWEDLAYLPVTLVAGPAAKWKDLFSTTSIDPDFQTISEQVFRFEYTYTLTDGTLSVNPVLNVPGMTNALNQSAAPDNSQDRSLGFSVGSRWYDSSNKKGYICLDNSTGAAVWGSLGMKDVGAVVVAIAVLDPTSRVIVYNYTALAGSFPDAPANSDIAASWINIVNTPSFAQTAAIPKQAAAAVRIYQRAFPFVKDP